MSWHVYLPRLLVMALTTYLIRMLPIVLMRGKIHHRFIRSFLAYVPYAVLTAMTVPDVLFSTGHVAGESVLTFLPTVLGILVGVCLSLRRKGLLTVAVAASLTVLVGEWLCAGLGLF